MEKEDPFFAMMVEGWGTRNNAWISCTETNFRQEPFTKAFFMPIIDDIKVAIRWSIATWLFLPLGFSLTIIFFWIASILEPLFSMIMEEFGKFILSIKGVTFLVTLLGKFILFILKIIAIFLIGIIAIVLLAILTNIFKGNSPLNLNIFKTPRMNPVTIEPRENIDLKIPTLQITPVTNKSSEIIIAISESQKTPGRYPESSNRTLISDDLNGKSAWDLRMMRNEIFARYGYIFQDGKVKDYFSQQSWYAPKYKDVSSMLTEIERENIRFIQQYEKRLK